MGIALLYSRGPNGWNLGGAPWLGLARLPGGVSMPQLYGGAVLCGIGFTMSLFIGDLAFRGAARGDEVTLAVFVGSLLSAAAGLTVLAAASRRKG